MLLSIHHFWIEIIIGMSEIFPNFILNLVNELPHETFPYLQMRYFKLTIPNILRI